MAMIRKKRFFDGDLFGDFDRMHEFIEEMMSESLADFEKAGSGRGRPLVYGFSFKMGENGKPVVSEFGNVKQVGRKKGVEDEREPLVDVIDDKNEVKVIAELPGVSKEEVKLSVLGSKLGIRVSNADRRYAKDVSLPARVSKNAKASFKNGILEVVLKKV